MVTRVSPQEYLGVVDIPPIEPIRERLVYVQQPSLVDPVASPLDDQAFRYIVVIGIVIMSIAALKYILKDK